MTLLFGKCRFYPVRIIGKKPIFKGTNENSVDQKKRILLNKDISMFKGK